MNKSEPLLLLAPLWTEHRDPVPVEVLFGRLAIRDELFGTFPTFGPIALGPMGTPLHGGWSGGRPSDFSESAPTTQADVSIDGNSWWYPFDEYVIAAQVDCVVVATPDRKKYFNIPSDAYSFASKLPNFIVRNATAKDVEYWIRYYEPPIKDKDLKKIITKYYRTVGETAAFVSF